MGFHKGSPDGRARQPRWQQGAQLAETLTDLAGEGVLILSKGEINHYLPTGFRSLEGAVELLKPENLVTWLEARREDAFLDGLEAIAYQVLGIPGGDQEEVHDAAGQLVKATAKPERRPSVRKTATDTSEASVQEKSV